MPHGEQDAARRAVLKWLAAHQRSRSWLWREAGVAPNTLNDWLRGDRSITEVTQGKIETALGWSAGTIMDIVDDVTNSNDETSSEMSAGASSLLFRRPEGLTDEEWRTMRENIEGYVEWLMWRVSGGDTAQ